MAAAARASDHRYEGHVCELSSKRLDEYLATEKEAAVLFAECVQALVGPRQQRPCQFELIGRDDEGRAPGRIARRRGGHADNRVGCFVQQRRPAEPALDEEPRQRAARCGSWSRSRPSAL